MAVHDVPAGQADFVSRALGLALTPLLPPATPADHHGHSLTRVLHESGYCFFEHSLQWLVPSFHRSMGAPQHVERFGMVTSVSSGMSTVGGFLATGPVFCCPARHALQQPRKRPLQPRKDSLVGQGPYACGIHPSACPRWLRQYQDS